MANFWQNPQKVGICWISKRQFKFRWRAEQFTAKVGWDCDGNGLRFARVLGARGRHQPPAPWHISISDPTVSPHSPRTGCGAQSLQDEPFPNTQLTNSSLIDTHLLPSCCSSAPKLTLLLLHFPPSLGKIFRENNPTLYQLLFFMATRVCVISSFRVAGCPCGSGRAWTQLCGWWQRVWSHHTCSSWLLLKPSQPHICLLHSHITHRFLCYSLTKILHAFESGTISPVASLQPALAALP